MPNRTYYINLRNNYLPKRIKLIFILESPPANGRYFYNPQGTTTEPLFSAMMKLMDYHPKDKADGLAEFQKRCYFLVDVTYQPINRIRGARRNEIILRHLPYLLDDLKAVTRNQRTKIILVKANICRMLEAPLKELCYNVVNDGIIVPFPSTGQQNNFFNAINQFLAKLKNNNLI